jgi:hypothetical protein
MLRHAVTRQRTFSILVSNMMRDDGERRLIFILGRYTRSVRINTTTFRPYCTTHFIYIILIIKI